MAATLPRASRTTARHGSTGIQPGDILTALAGQPVPSVAALQLPRFEVRTFSALLIDAGKVEQSVPFVQLVVRLRGPPGLSVVGRTGHPNERTDPSRPGARPWSRR